MSTRSELTLFLGIRLHDSERFTLGRVEDLLEELTAMEADGRIPLHWNTPLYPLFAGSSRPLHDLITEIKGRVASRGDVIAPSGFRGALHPLLDDHELERELVWCRRNPWLPGFRELFGQDPGLIIPVVPDLARETAGGVYSSAGFWAVGLPLRLSGRHAAQKRSRRDRRLDRAWQEQLLLSRAPERAAVLAARVVGLPDLAEDSPLLAALAAHAPEALLLLIDLPQAPAAGTAEAGRERIGKDRPLSRLFEALAYRHSLRPAALSPEVLSRWVSRETTAAAAASDRAARPGVSVLLHRSEGCALLEDEGGLLPTGRLERVQGYRRSGRRRNEDTRKALELLVPDSEEGMQGQAGPTTARRPLFGSPGQILFAEMGGAVSLPGPEFVAHFVDGRLRGLARSGGELAGGAPAESWFAFDGARRVLRTVSAASFERDGDHGLATSLGVELPPGRGQLQVLIEAYFREGQPELCLECSVRFPPGAPALEAGAPYEIPLLPFDERKPPELQVELEGGRIHREMVLPREGYLLTCGRSVRAAAEGAAVVLTADGAAPATVLPLRVCRESGRWSLRACLGGRTCPGRPLPVAGLTSQFSFRVGLEQA